MNRRPSRWLVWLLVAAQLLSFAPTATAIAGNSADAGSEMNCADMMPASESSEPCPCCPDGSAGAAACFSACSAVLGAIPTFVLPLGNFYFEPALARVFVLRADASEPPLKPPPIA